VSGAEDGPREAGPREAGPPATTGEQACADLAGRTCERMISCEPFVVQILFGNAQGCLARMRLLCLLGASAPGARATPASISQCSRGLETAGCADIVSWAAFDACFPPGQRATGAACGARSQCASSYCRSKGTRCGICSARVAAGGRCDDEAGGQCEAALVCSTAGTCVALAGLGTGCNPQSRPCQAHLACTGGLCVVPATTVGAVCTDNDCSGHLGLFCAKAAGALRGTCQRMLVAPVGERCGALGPNLIVCGGGATCLPDPQGTTRCVAPAPDGQPCGDGADGRGCMLPAACVEKVCRVATPAMCG
jgi:hypothetical protein